MSTVNISHHITVVATSAEDYETLLAYVHANYDSLTVEEDVPNLTLTVTSVADVDVADYSIV